MGGCVSGRVYVCQHRECEGDCIVWAGGWVGGCICPCGCVDVGGSVCGMLSRCWTG